MVNATVISVAAAFNAVSAVFTPSKRTPPYRLLALRIICQIYNIYL